MACSKVALLKIESNDKVFICSGCNNVNPVLAFILEAIHPEADYPAKEMNSNDMENDH